MLSLEKAGVKTIPDKRIQQTLYLGMGSTFLGGVGFVSASFAAACVATIVSDADLDDEEESLTSSDTNSVVFKPSSRVLAEDNNDLLTAKKILSKHLFPANKQNILKANDGRRYNLHQTFVVKSVPWHSQERWHS